jgi:serine/threonine-protein kinase
MGTVYEALREELGNMVAIKLLHPNQVQKKDAVQRFHHEAKAAARIGHPNICEVYDVGTLDDGRPYLVMDRLVGVTLAERIHNEGGLPFQDVIDTLTQVLSGLHAAHEKGIIHRDIKPENVFLTQRVGCPPVAKILDFGVSKVLASSPGAVGFSDVEVTRTGVVLGTPYYLAPEQAKGDRNLDARVDLYACGVMLYEALTGRRPFRAANYNALLIAILTSTPRPARDIRPDLPSEFTKIIEKAMDREPAARFQSALEFQAALQPYSHGASPPRPTSVPPARRAPSVFPPPAPRVAAPPPPPPPPPPESSLPEPRGSDDDLAAFVESASNDDLPAERAPSASPMQPAVPRTAPRPAPSVAPPAGIARPPTHPGALRPSAFPRATPPRPASVAPPAAQAPLARPPTPPPVPAEAPLVPAVRPSTPSTPNFDDQETEVDLPRPFTDGRAQAPRASPGAPLSVLETFAPRGPAPVIGPPLQPPPPDGDDDDSATEIMSAAVRSTRSEPPPHKNPESERPVPGRPRPPRP